MQNQQSWTMGMGGVFGIVFLAVAVIIVYALRNKLKK
ncbi:hypothetical protein BH11BAC2_BH11BAC2_22700 [soil metagenome]